MAFPDFREARGFDHLKTLQRITEEHVDHMKEGTYLEVCGLHKSLYDEINSLVESNTKLFDLWQTARNRVNVPFQARVGLPMNEEALLRMHREWIANSEAMDALRADLGVAERSLQNLKPINRITRRVREDAIRDFCKGDERGVGNGAWTFQNLTQHYQAMFWFETEAEHNDFVNSLNERQIYEDYKRMFNERVRRSTREAQMLKMNLEREMKRVERRMELLSMSLNQVDGHPRVNEIRRRLEFPEPGEDVQMR